MKAKAHTWRKSMPRRWCNSFCSIVIGRGGHCSRSPIRLRATSAGSSRGRGGRNIAKTARTSSSSAANPGSTPINTANRAGHSRAPSTHTRQPMVNTCTAMTRRNTAASALASGHVASLSAIKWRSTTTRQNANTASIPMATQVTWPAGSGTGKSKRQAPLTNSSASPAKPTSQGVSAPNL
ncbi:hypothetical protein D3C81_1491440 [compost metagenome]